MNTNSKVQLFTLDTVISAIIGISISIIGIVYQTEQESSLYYSHSFVKSPNKDFAAFLTDTTKRNYLFKETVIIWNGRNAFIDKQDISKTRPIELRLDTAMNLITANLIKKSRPELTTENYVSRVNKTIQLILEGDIGFETGDGVVLEIYFSHSNKLTRVQHIHISADIKGSKQDMIEIPYDIALNGKTFKIEEIFKHIVLIVLLFSFGAFYLINRRKNKFNRFVAICCLIFVPYFVCKSSSQVIYVSKQTFPTWFEDTEMEYYQKLPLGIRNQYLADSLP